MMRPLIQNLVATIRASAAARWMTVQQLRLQTRARLTTQRAHRCSARRASVVTSAGTGEDSDAWLEAEVQRVIDRHPDGVRAFDIGNELGVDWRRIPAVTSRLVEGAYVEQVGQDFYPVEKAN
jgi:hypothetical protein